MFKKEFLTKTNESILIREALESDAENTIEYVKKVADETDFLTFESKEFNTTIKEEALLFKKCLASQNMLFLLGFMSNNIVCMLHLQSESKKRLSHIGEITMSVIKNKWGQGIASLLIDSLLIWCKESSKISKINLCVHPENKKAISLYKKKGFVLEGIRKRGFLIGKTYFDIIEMGLLL